jgi:hypothetical protein
MQIEVSVMSEPEDTPEHGVGGPSVRRGRAKNPAVIGAAATISAALIAGIFSLLASQSGGGSSLPQGVVTILAAPASGVAGTSVSNPVSSGGTYLADLTALTAPRSSGISDTVGGRALIEVISLADGDEARYQIPDGANKFTAVVGISDTGVAYSGSPPPTTRGVFAVFADGVLLTQVTLMPGQLAVLSVSVSNHKILQLGYTSTGGSNDEADYGMARFTL